MSKEQRWNNGMSPGSTAGNCDYHGAPRTPKKLAFKVPSLKGLTTEEASLIAYYIMTVEIAASKEEVQANSEMVIQILTKGPPKGGPKLKPARPILIRAIKAVNRNVIKAMEKAKV